MLVAPLNDVHTDDDNDLIDLLPTMAWTAAPEGNVTYVNRQCVVFTGLPAERLLGDGMAACIHPDDLLIREKMKAQIDKRRNFEVEFRLRRADGEYIRCLARANAVKDSAGNVVKWVGTTIDVEDMRRANDELRVQEEHLQLALDAADIGIWRLKLPSYHLTVDERTRRHLDLEGHEVRGYRPQDLIHPADFAQADFISPDAQGRYFTEHRVRQRDGSYRWQAIHWRHYFSGDGANATPVLVTGTSMDVTSRKQAEAEREDLGHRYRIALAAAELGTWYCDVPAGELHLDDRARIHLDMDQPVANFEQCLARIYEPDRQRTVESLKRQLRKTSSDRRAEIEFRVHGPDEELRWISAQLHAIFHPDNENEPIRIIGVTRDITEIKRAVEKVRQLNADLELRVQQRTAELTAANQELESFAYTVSHDLRAPLRAMWGFCDALVEDYGDHLPAEAREYLQHVIDGSRHLGEIIDGLLTLSRSTRGTLRCDTIDLSSTAEQVLKEMARAEPDRKVAWAIQPGLRAVGDSRMLQAVMRNLLGNAWKYTANRTDALIRVYRADLDGRSVFCVEDNGAGFSMEHAEKLFQPFQRLHRQDEFVGLGIGLATVQRIVHRHGGNVSGSGAPGQGAVFRFSLGTPGESTMPTSEEERV